ncbi:radical SAM protein [Mycoplasmatota bacterium WC44]
MYVLGIINSRRLGKSLGLDIVGVDRKRCNLQCVYCECGNGLFESERGIYANFNDSMIELEKALSENQVDIVTFSGNGEPTLNIEIGRYIDEIKRITNKPVCVITNSTLLHDEDVFNSLLRADVVMPSLDSVDLISFTKIDRPHKSVNLELIVESLIRFSSVYRGKMFLEIFLVKSINDNIDELDKLIDVVKQINPTELHINTVDRVPAEKIELYNDEINDIYKHFVKNLKIEVKLF